MTELRQENSGASSWEGGTPGLQRPGEVGLCQQVGQNRYPGAFGPGHPDHCILARGGWPPFPASTSVGPPCTAWGPGPWVRLLTL